MHERLRRVCFIDYDREIALVADLKKRDGLMKFLESDALLKNMDSTRPSLPFWSATRGKAKVWAASF